VLNERQLLQCLYHPFLINIVYAFQNRENLYLVMDLVSGGDLRYHLIKQTKFNEEQTSKIKVKLEFFVAYERYNAS
jgi:serine/threonine protein kinase